MHPKEIAVQSFYARQYPSIRRPAPESFLVTHLAPPIKTVLLLHRGDRKGNEGGGKGVRM